MSNTVISVENLTKRYDLGVIGTGTLSRDLNRWWARVRHQPDPYTRIGQRDHFERIGESILALDDVSFTVQQGEALGIIGKNGAGKSTLLKILSRVTAPTSGVVKIKGRIGSLLEVGTGFHPELTGRENVYLNGAILGMRKEEVDRKFDEIVDFSGFKKFIDTPVKRYSSGMYVRLAFAVAAHLDPEILVVDEVLAVGDVEFQKKCLGKMSDVAKQGRTVLFVSHNMGSINALCENGILLDSGSIIAHGQIDNVISEYLNIFKTNYKIIEKSRNKNQLSSNVSLISIELSDKKGNPKEVFLTNQDIFLKLIFQLDETSDKLNPVIYITDEYDNILVSSTNFNEKDWYFEKQKPGIYQSICKIPADLLNNRRYFLDIFFVKNFHERISVLENKIPFSVEDGGSYRDIYGGHIAGLMRPYFEWKTKKTE